jgi:hypothetical protein
MKHKIKHITDLPWDLGPKFNKNKNCGIPPPTQIFKVLAEAQAAEIHIPDEVYNWWMEEEKHNG